MIVGLWYRTVTMVFICIYIYVCFFNLPTYLPTYLHTYISTYLHTYIPTYIHTYIPTYLPTYLHTYIHTYIPTYLPTYLHTYIHTFIHTYIHTHRTAQNAYTNFNDDLSMMSRPPSCQGPRSCKPRCITGSVNVWRSTRVKGDRCGQPVGLGCVGFLVLQKD